MELISQHFIYVPKKLFKIISASLNTFLLIKGFKSVLKYLTQTYI